MVAKHASATVDGNLSDWSPEEFVELDQKGEYILRDAGLPDREEWFAKAAIRWDDRFLYVAFLVLDQDISCLDLVSRDWRDADNVRIFLSTQAPEKRTPAITENDFLLYFSPTQQNGTEPPAIKSISMGGYVHQDLESKIKVASNLWQGGYLIEAAIPWSELKVQPAAGLTLGCNLLGDDSDNGYRRFTGMTSFLSTDYWNSPKSLGVLRLAP